MIVLRVGDIMHSLFYNDQKLGIFLKRDDFLFPRIKELRLAIHLQLLEANVLANAILSFLNSDLKAFDASVGDRKCQVRALMIFEMLQDNMDVLRLQQRLNEINALKLRLHDFVKRLAFDQCVETEKILHELRGLSMQDFFKKHNLSFEVSYNELILSLCNLASLGEHNDIVRANHIISGKKIRTILNLAKKKLSLISIDYEQKLSRDYGNDEIFRVVQVVESKGFCYMTAFFPSFKLLLKKFKQQNGSVLQKTIFICVCGGVKEQKYNYFKAVNNF